MKPLLSLNHSGFTMDDLARALLRHLAETPFACSSLSRHPGSGTTNFVLRGVLVEPRDGGLTKTVIVKHSTTFAAVNKNFPVDAARSVRHASS